MVSELGNCMYSLSRAKCREHFVWLFLRAIVYQPVYGDPCGRFKQLVMGSFIYLGMPKARCGSTMVWMSYDYTGFLGLVWKTSVMDASFIWGSQGHWRSTLMDVSFIWAFQAHAWKTSLMDVSFMSECQKPGFKDSCYGCLIYMGIPRAILMCTLT